MARVHRQWRHCRHVIDHVSVTACETMIDRRASTVPVSEAMIMVLIRTETATHVLASVTTIGVEVLLIGPRAMILAVTALITLRQVGWMAAYSMTAPLRRISGASGHEVHQVRAYITAYT